MQDLFEWERIIISSLPDVENVSILVVLACVLPPALFIDQVFAYALDLDFATVKISVDVTAPI